MYPTELSYPIFSGQPETVGESRTKEFPSWLKNYLVVVQRNQSKAPINIASWKFTEVGTELLSLIDHPLDMAYLEKVADFFVQKKARVTIGKVNHFLPDGGYNYKILKVIDPTQQL